MICTLHALIPFLLLHAYIQAQAQDRDHETRLIPVIASDKLKVSVWYNAVSIVRIHRHSFIHNFILIYFFRTGMFVAPTSRSSITTSSTFWTVRRMKVESSTIRACTWSSLIWAEWLETWNHTVYVEHHTLHPKWTRLADLAVFSCLPFSFSFRTPSRLKWITCKLSRRTSKEPESCTR